MRRSTYIRAGVAAPRGGSAGSTPREAAVTAPTVVAAALTLAALVLFPSPALAAQTDDVFVEVNPSTIEAGKDVGIRASCPDNTKSAVVRSDASDREITVVPQDGFLVQTVTIPADTDPRSYTVRLTCPGGETATATLHVVTQTRPTQGPATGFGGMAGDGPGGGLLIGVGLLTIAAGAMLGVFTLRRRAGHG
jgi:hypothetical protein